ncbi:glycogen branching enzyme [Tanticharoenia sakaeratensis NBRC 103193]|uniref:1,4-alpha-glucan branching enzyme GlgB n=1 Tax=Tanticharoenia sakaeratensis NBRC 103193 TaxID=1231623 RepID=A0A0D6MGY7_9PROT|nr:glycogen branching enzyme [Tanticharoenia sakaeratensis NBRC 103193]GBQ18227.1 glycogen branching protein [Tanticharoenia sakaeratensis NBRC 103193]
MQDNLVASKKISIPDGAAETQAAPLPPARRSDVETIDALLHGTCHDPFAFLGRHKAERQDIVRVFQPDAKEVRLVVIRPRAAPIEKPMTRIDPRGVYVGAIPNNCRYELKILWADGWQHTHDPYSFGLLLGELDLHLFREGRHQSLHRIMGAQAMEIEGVSGVRFAVWAPNARRVSVVGDFNIWDGRRHPMRLRHEAGIWELFVPDIGPGERYKYEIIASHGGLLPGKADPYALAAEHPPATASVVDDPTPFVWNDADWLATRGTRQNTTAPISIYEMSAASWRRSNGGYPTWEELADALIPYVTNLGFTHIELLPITEYPFSGSWGYQPLGMFAPTARHGHPRDFARFVDRCHQANLGVIMDWVPAHFPSDMHGLAAFDGTCLYEHADPREGFHQDWSTLIYNFGRNEVSGFLIASALCWLERYHVDGLRVDAVASMLYRDYSRKDGEWLPNIHGGRENLEAIAFLRGLSDVMHTLHPDVMLIAEESTAWPGVTKSPDEGGLGFRFKWNMGWMHDTLRYFGRDPIYRGHHAGDVTFGMIYAYSERFVLPLSHDEVVHGKGSLLARMPGDDWQKHANLRTLYGLMWSHPGRKLLFMGQEFAQAREWRHDHELDWHHLDEPLGRGMQLLIGDLNAAYRGFAALHRSDDDWQGFRWIIADDSQNCVFALLRSAPDCPSVLVVCNMTPVPRPDYRIGVPDNGFWHECINTDGARYGGSNVGNFGGASTTPVGAHGFEQSIVLTLPPLSTLYLSTSSLVG